VVHNGISDPAGSTAPESVSDGAFRVGIVGQVGAWKGHDDLLEAFAMVHQRHGETELHIFGKANPEYRKKLARRAVELGLDHQVRWHDFVADRGDIYSHLDLCAVPTRTEEPFGLVALEAGFFGKPAVVSRRGGLPEIILHEVNGLIVDGERPDQIAEAICRLI